MSRAQIFEDLFLLEKWMAILGHTVPHGPLYPEPEEVKTGVGWGDDHHGTFNFNPLYRKFMAFTFAYLLTILATCIALAGLTYIFKKFGPKKLGKILKNKRPNIFSRVKNAKNKVKNKNNVNKNVANKNEAETVVRNEYKKF